VEEQPVLSGNPSNDPAGQGIAAKVEGAYVVFGPGVAGSVSAQQDAAFSKGATIAVAAGHDMVFSKGGTGVTAVGHDLTLSQGGATLLTVGGQANISKGGALLVNSGGETTIDKGGSGLVITPKLTASHSQLGIVIAGKVELNGESRVMFSTIQAAAFGAVFGAVFGVIAWLFRRR
jgi:hypothetical protein